MVSTENSVLVRKNVTKKSRNPLEEALSCDLRLRVPMMSAKTRPCTESPTEVNLSLGDPNHSNYHPSDLSRLQG